jgi:hypothetical protein
VLPPGSLLHFYAVACYGLQLWARSVRETLDEDRADAAGPPQRTRKVWRHGADSGVLVRPGSPASARWTTIADLMAARPLLSGSYQSTRRGPRKQMRGYEGESDESFMAAR